MSASPPVPSTQDPRLFTAKEIWIASFIAGPPAAGILYGVSLWSLGRRREAIAVALAFSFLLSAAALALAFVVPEGVPGVAFGFAYASIAMFFHERLLGEAMRAHVAAGGQAASGWLTAGLGCVSLGVSLTLLGIALGTLLLLPGRFTDPLFSTVTLSPTQSVLYEDRATKQDAREVGAAMARLGFDDFAARVRRPQTRLDICVAVTDGAWNDDEVISDFTRIAEGLRLQIGEPASVALCSVGFTWSEKKKLP